MSITCINWELTQRGNASSVLCSALLVKNVMIDCTKLPLKDDYARTDKENQADFINQMEI